VKFVKVLFAAKSTTEEGFLQRGILLHPGPKISGGLSPAILSSRFSTRFGAPAVGVCPGSPISPPGLTPPCCFSSGGAADAAVTWPGFGRMIRSYFKIVFWLNVFVGASLKIL